MVRRRNVIGSVLGGICFFALLAAVTVGEAAGATYYVSPVGSDSNGGSINYPFKTIQKAADIVNPGDTVIVKDGTYSYGGSTYGIFIRRSGTSSSPITFRAENKWGTLLTGAGHSAVAFNTGVHDIVIEGFEITYSGDGAGIWLSDNAGIYNITVYGNKVHNNTHQGIYMGWGNHDVTVDSNVVYACGSVAYNDHGIYVMGWNQTIMNNTVYDIPYGWEIQIGVDGAGSNGSNFNIINNTLGPNNGVYAASNIVIFRHGGSNLFSNVNIQNNLAYGGTNALIRMSHLRDSDFADTLRVNNNLWYGTGFTGLVYGRLYSFTKYALSGNITGLDPLLVNPATHDYHLQSASAAIDAGLPYSGRTYDADGNTIIGNPDIGAYEFVHTMPRMKPL